MNAYYNAIIIIYCIQPESINAINAINAINSHGI